jgi:uncharacterized protein involved in response to NO
MQRSLLAGPATPLAGAPPSFVQKGFRPFFLLGALVATAMLPAWLLVLTGSWVPKTPFDLTVWHAHEMVFGFGAAIIAGFLLTAVGNWTQRETAVGMPLLLLAVLFVAGRLAVSFGALLPRWAPLLVDGAFLPVLALVLARPLLVARARANIVVVVMVLALAAANVLTHLGALGIAPSWQRRGVLVGVDVVILVASLIAGRVFPMFTRNATREESIRSSPRLNTVSMAALVSSTLLDVAGVESPWKGVLLIAIGALFVARAWRWGARYTLRTPLLWVLHAGYAWLCVGFVLRGVAMFTYRVPPSAGLHALTVGAIGMLTLGMMSRVSLGHTGRMLEAPRSAVVAFVLVILATIARVVGPLIGPAWVLPSLVVAGSLFAAAFALFLVGYARMLVSPRVDGKPG